MKFVRLGDVARPTAERGGQGTSIPVYSVTKHEGFVRSDEYFKKQVFSRDLSNYKLVREGHFAYATIHLDEGSIGVAPEDSLVSPMYTSFATDTHTVCSDYLIRFLKSPRALASYPTLGKGSAERRRSISFARLAELRIPLPPLAEQQRIAAILDTADELRIKRRQALAHLDTLTRSIFHSMFGDPSRATVRRELGDLLASIDSGSSPVSEDRPASSEEWGILKVSAVTTQVFIESENKALTASPPDRRHEVRVGDVLFTRKNTPKLVAAVAVVRSTRPRLLLPDLVFRLNIADRKALDPEYLQAVLAYPTQRALVQRLAGGSAASMSNIAKSKLLQVTIPVPSLELQQTFATRVAAVERLKATHRKHLAELDTLFASLQHRAFKGEL